MSPKLQRLCQFFQSLSSFCVNYGNKNNHVKQQSPTFLAPGTGFVEDSFSTGVGGRFQDNSSALHPSSPPAMCPGSSQAQTRTGPCPEVGDP